MGGGEVGGGSSEGVDYQQESCRLLSVCRDEVGVVKIQ